MSTTTDLHASAVRFLELGAADLSRAEKTMTRYIKLSFQYGVTLPEIAAHANLTEERVRSMLVG